MPRINSELFEYSSLIPHRVTPDEIEFERQRLEAEIGRTVKVWQIEHTVRSGTTFTRITWEVL